MTEKLHHEYRQDHGKPKGPTEKSFGLTFAVFFALVTALQVYRHGFGVGPAITAFGCLAFLAASYLAPTVLRPLNILWAKLGFLLHKIVNPIIMGILFFGVFTPMGLVMRIFGVDLLKIRRNGASESHWVLRDSEDIGPSSMHNQF